jgi:TonB family protein
MSGNLLFDALVRASLILAIGLIAVRCLRPQAAALRHWIMAITIALAAAQPAIRLAVPEWRVRAATVARETLSAQPLATPGVSVTFQAAFDPAPATPVGRIDWLSLFVRAWLAGTIMILASMLMAAAWLVWHSWRAIEPGPHWSQERDALAAAMGLDVIVRLRETRHPALLVTWGAIRPVVLLPRGAASWPIERVRVVLAHELAHVQRRDWLVHLGVEIGRACYWPNPLFWLACAQLRIESEQACDDRVLGLGNNGTSYASHLVDLARSFRAHGRTWLPAPSMARPSTLERRVVAMLSMNVNRRPVSRWSKLSTALLLVATALPIAAFAEHASAPAGVLRDPSGRVLPGATVRLSAIGQEAIHETQSDSTGAFQFPELADGDYMLSARLPGFLSDRQRVRVSAGMPVLNMTLQVATLRETITVRSDGSAQGPATPSRARRIPSAPSCGTTELGGNLKPPMKLKDVRPVYKPELAANNVEGEVLLQAVIGVDGKVRGLEVVSAVNMDLEEAAITAVSQWEFSPTYLNCQAIEVRMFVSASFKIDR